MLSIKKRAKTAKKATTKATVSDEAPKKKGAKKKGAKKKAPPISPRKKEATPVKKVAPKKRAGHGRVPPPPAEEQKKSKPTFSFLKRGEQAHVTIDQQDKADAEESKEANLRYWMAPNSENTLTFLDGELLPSGLIDLVMYYEHQVYLDGSWKNWFLCIAEDEPCPICEGGLKPSLVGALTVIDHRTWVAKDGVEHGPAKRLFLMKRATLGYIQALATEQGGLTGLTVTVSREGDDSAQVGNLFYAEGRKTLKSVLKEHGFTQGAFDYEDVLTYRGGAALREIGFGEGSTKGHSLQSGRNRSGGYKSGKQGGGQSSGVASYADADYDL